jgi:hypothetical protein
VCGVSERPQGRQAPAQDGLDLVSPLSVVLHAWLPSDQPLVLTAWQAACQTPMDLAGAVLIAVMAVFALCGWNKFGSVGGSVCL